MAKKHGRAQAVYNSAGITLTDGDDTGLFVDGNGNLLTAGGAGGFGPTSATATETSVASSATSVALTTANTARKGVTVYNDSTAVLYLRLSATAATTALYTTQIGTGGYYEVPYGYSGAITGIWASANGAALITVMT